ncbi:hypothetical protein [Deinococcus hopiensis]|nr:hypothetical protein [Deinococcus hopiensis]
MTDIQMAALTAAQGAVGAAQAENFDLLVGMDEQPGDGQGGSAAHVAPRRVTPMGTEVRALLPQRRRRRTLPRPKLRRSPNRPSPTARHPAGLRRRCPSLLPSGRRCLRGHAAHPGPRGRALRSWEAGHHAALEKARSARPAGGGGGRRPARSGGRSEQGLGPPVRRPPPGKQLLIRPGTPGKGQNLAHNAAWVNSLKIKACVRGKQAARRGEKPILFGGLWLPKTRALNRNGAPSGGETAHPW